MGEPGHESPDGEFGHADLLPGAGRLQMEAEAAAHEKGIALWHCVVTSKPKVACSCCLLQSRCQHKLKLTTKVCTAEWSTGHNPLHGVIPAR